jgi:hypothetical protein
MGLKTALELIQSFSRKRGLPVPTAVVGSTDAGVLQLLELLNAVGSDLVRRPMDWQVLKRRTVFACLATEDQGSILSLFGVPAAAFSPETLFNDTRRLPIYGPLSDIEYQEIKALLPTGPFQQFLLRNDHLFITGSLTAGDSLSIMYTTTAWVETGSGTGVYTTEVTDDAYIPVFPDDLIMLGLEWMWRREKELKYDSQFGEYTAKLLDSGDPKPVLLGHRGRPAEVKPGIIVPAGNWTV